MVLQIKNNLKGFYSLPEVMPLKSHNLPWPQLLNADKPISYKQVREEDIICC